ncbi:MULTISPECIES: magnesium transporter [unclassified Imperialibacter]|uniref:magnesium transporter n=1 Tax=unclassified Imperialibacter TaxID=2629706 RepID=UPI0012573ACD|nr:MULTISPECIES: magnesium transporter [unclassified Imperialibacter]CAD5278411.1 Magnesium transporter MgtE [Imperialibacter sp. 89]CAD5292544.1 Magnesium transporter MgtE [Imperialibacter sp. 75]VVS99671.1 Magnesium transporter MgtE [Imperialibacter sp. EC-SDR9]
MEALIQFELSKEYLERFQGALDEKDEQFIKASLDGVNPADITQLLYEFDTEESKYVIDLLEKQISAQIINDLDEDTRTEFLGAFTVTEISSFLDFLDSDDCVDILMELSLQTREEVVALIRDEQKARHVQELLHYDEDVAGGLMAKELIKCNLNWTIRQCIEEIRKQAETVQKIYSVYVVNNTGKLIGKVSLKKIIIAEDSAKIADIYDDDIVSVATHMDEDEVASIMRKYDLEAVPVINAKGRLVGRITIDDIVDVMQEQAEEERQLMAGISDDVEEDDSVWKLSKARLPWLIIGMVGGLMGARFIGLFEGDIALIPAVAFFIPLITATGGNVGIQSSSIVVQSLANPNVFAESMVRRLIKVLTVAVLNGLILALLVFGSIILLYKEEFLAITVSIALFSVVLLASFMGTITPIVLDKFGINPALASGPFITTANDLLGLGVYFTIANLLYGIF